MGYIRMFMEVLKVQVCAISIIATENITVHVCWVLSVLPISEVCAGQLFVGSGAFFGIEV